MTQQSWRSPFDQVFDAAIVGAGYAGYAAALALHEAGRRVVLIDRQSELLWETGRAFAPDAGALDDPAWQRFISDLTARGGAAGSVIDGAIAEVAATAELLACGITCLSYVGPLAVERTGDAITSLIVGSKSTHRRIAARQWIDATETGELLALIESGAGQRPRQPDRQIFRIFVQHHDWADELPKQIDSPAALSGSRLTVGRTAWPTERVLTVELPGDFAEPRRAIVPALEALHAAAASAMRGAVVNHCGVTTFPIYTDDAEAVLLQAYGNVAVASPAAVTGAIATPADRFKLGLLAAAKLDELPVAEAPADLLERAISEVTARESMRAEVAVVGGGTGGALAAIAAARAGADVLCIEPLAFAGGIGTGGGIHNYFYGVPGGLQAEVDRRVKDMMRLFGPMRQVRGFHPDAKKLVLDEMMREAGVRWLPHTLAVAATTRGSRLKMVLASRPNQTLAIEADFWIDATGDGDLCAMAGVPYRFGRPGDGMLHAYSQSAGQLLHSDDRERPEVIMRGTNYDAGWVDPIDADDLTRARQVGVAQYLKERYDNANRPTYIAPAIGLRQGRHIETDYTLNLADLVERRTFDDAIGFTGANYDSHGGDYEFESDESVFWTWICREWRGRIACQMPYRIMLPKGLSNVLIACRALGVSLDAQYTCRMQRDMQRIGEAAGNAAALALREGTDARGVPRDALRQRLAATGALDVKEADAPHPFNSWIAESTSFDVSDEQIEEGLAALRDGRSDAALWHLYRAADRVRDAVRGYLDSAEPRVSWLAAGVCAMWGDASAEPRLIEAIANREVDDDDSTKRNRRLVPAWMAAIAMLRCCGTDRCLDVLGGVAATPGLMLNVRTTIGLTLERLLDAGRVSDPSRVANLATALLADPVPGSFVVPQRSLFSLLAEPDGVDRPSGPFQHRPEAVLSTHEDHRWQLHLVVARLCQKLGQPLPEPCERYLRDPRATVRRAFASLAQTSPADTEPVSA
ncbi:MAG: FAD-dependent oxidoreductase [Phycisphaeraceae bacterium]